MWQAEYYFSEAQSQHSSHSLFQDINCSKLPEEKSFWARKSCSQGWREDKGMCVWEYFKQGGDKVFRGNSYLVCYHTGTLSLSWMCRPHSSLKSSALALSGKGFPLFFKCCVKFFICSNVMFSVKLSVTDCISSKMTQQYFQSHMLFQNLATL